LWNIIFTFYHTRVRPQCDYSTLGRWEIMLFIGKPKGRSKMISNGRDHAPGTSHKTTTCNYNPQQITHSTHSTRHVSKFDKTVSKFSTESRLARLTPRFQCESQTLAKMFLFACFYESVFYVLSSSLPVFLPVLWALRGFAFITTFLFSFFFPCEFDPYLWYGACYICDPAHMSVLPFYVHVYYSNSCICVFKHVCVPASCLCCVMLSTYTHVFVLCSFPDT